MRRQPTVIIAANEHQVGALRRFKLGVRAVLVDQQIGVSSSETIERTNTPGHMPPPPPLPPPPPPSPPPCSGLIPLSSRGWEAFGACTGPAAI
jgi:hypothetical protein